MKRTKRVDKLEGFEANYVCGDICNSIALPGKYDLIVILSAVHHIPDRLSLFTLLKGYLTPGGRIVCYEPSHYVPRLLSLTKRMILNGYLLPKFYLNKENFVTHHFCTLGEYSSICKRVAGLKIVSVEYICGRVLRLHESRLRKLLPLKWLSTEIGIVLQRTD